MKPIHPIARACLILLPILLLGAACSRTGPTAAGGSLPKITAAALDQAQVPNYGSLALSVALQAQYTNPYDQRQVSLDGSFTGPDGQSMSVPGYWDGDSAWQVRFTPSQVGEWTYALSVRDSHGTSQPSTGQFTVTPSDGHGWLQAGNWVDPAYSGHYLVYKDGTPFYGVGHDDALNILVDGFSLEGGVGLFNQMQKAGENYVVWWPLYSNSPISGSYSDYNLASMKVIDAVVADARKKGIFLVFTIWDHPELRDATHSWSGGRWTANGFSQLGSLSSFFTSNEAWAWQANFYRYLIARWGYSPAIGMWQTVSEINGTNAYGQTDAWHKQVNDYFTANDPYRHPTTASMSGDTDWPTGQAVMDAPQVHLYDFSNGALKIDVTHSAAYLAQWTARMWGRGAKPNWVGEYGVPDDSDYPELLHYADWAALASGAALTPGEWNSGGSFGEMTPAMQADIGRLAQFVAGLPLAKWNPAPLTLTSADPQVRGWGVAGPQGGLFWVQDFSQEGKSIDELRAGLTVRSGVRVDLTGLAAGTYTVTPYDTWQGSFLAPFEVTCGTGQACTLALPDFKSDMAFKLERK